MNPKKKRGLTIVTLKEQSEMQKKEKSITADRRLFLDATRERVVEDGDADAAFLLATPGKRIPGDEVERLGLSTSSGKVKQAERHADKSLKKSADK